ncbi:DUF58 domain-containing protein [Thiomonas sp.]|uniref:DUF58 domain-containing protein n=1 Tax=Thiomonas sp. TaxID=2047785 RepID=UPI00262CE22A|nr:DUF58 domain-containing protein [Thiomonas sp.]
MAWVEALALPHAAPSTRALLPAGDAAALIALARGQRVTAGTQPVALRSAGDQPAVWLSRGLDYAESRAYAPGDDLRDLHWRLLARTGRPYVKRYREEHAPALHLWLDLRPGMAFGTRGRTKAEQAARAALLAAAMQLLAAEGAAGELSLTLWRGSAEGEGGATQALGRGLPALRRLAAVLQHQTVRAEADAPRPDEDAEMLAAALQRAARVLPAGSRVLLASDAAGFDAPAVDGALWALAQRAAVALLWVQDAAEAALPAALPAQVPFDDLAARQSGVLPPAARAAFASTAQAERAARLARWRARGLAVVPTRGDDGDAALLAALRGLAR